MTRLRNEQAGAIYHVIARGVDRRKIFLDDDDFETYLRLLGRIVERQGWRLLGFCLMSNHVHLLIETPETNLGNGMQWLQSRYAMHFNQRYDRRGHLFETRFRSPMVTDHVRLARTVGYIVANPVAAALCSDPAEWRWGSHAMLADPPGWLAHSHLIDQLAASRGFAGYDALVAAHMSSRMLGGAR